MSVNVEPDSSRPLSERQHATIDGSFSRSFTNIRDNSERKQTKEEMNRDQEVDGLNLREKELDKLKVQAMAFTIDFGPGKQVDKNRLEQLAKKSQARHQRVQSMSASLTRPILTPQKPPLSGKLPRKTQGYNSEGYFSSDQEDSILSGSVKLKQSPLAQTTDIKSQIGNISPRNPKSPDLFLNKTRISKSPIVDSIMSRSDTLPSRRNLNLPLKQTNCGSYLRDVHRTPSYGNLTSSFTSRPTTMADIIDQSPEGIMLTDISSPELDILTPDNGLSTPEYRNSRSPLKIGRTDLKKITPKLELYIDDDIDRESNSSTGTYTIEGDNYTEEQKARMSIDRKFGDRLKSVEEVLDNTFEKDNKSDYIFDRPEKTTTDTVIEVVPVNKIFDTPKVSKDRNVLEISCCYESPTDNDLAVQTSKQIKSTRNYLEKIKSRVRMITDKTVNSTPRSVEDCDVGNFTSVTTSGVLSSKTPAKDNRFTNRRYSLSKSEMDQTDYVHRLTRESSIPVSLPSNKPFEDQFESSVLRNAYMKSLMDDSGVSSDVTPEQVVGKLSYLSLNRCKGDKTWIQEWAESVKKYNNDSFAKEDLNQTFELVNERSPQSPHNTAQGKGANQPRNNHSPVCTPTKIPSPVSTLHRRNKDASLGNQDTEAYLLKTQNAITNLQAKLLFPRSNNLCNMPPQLTSSLISEKTASRLPVSQLSRSNSLNYRLRRKDHSGDNSPLRSPGHYVITGSGLPASTRLLLNTSKSLEADRKRFHDSNMNSPSSDRGLLSNSSDDKTLSNRPSYDVEAILSPHRKVHTRHKSFDGRNSTEYFNAPDMTNANSQVSLKTVLRNNAFEAQNLYLTPRTIDPTRYQGEQKRSHQRISDVKEKPFNAAFGASIRRSSSFNTVNRNNNYLENKISNFGRYKNDDISDESDHVTYSQDSRYKRPNRSKLDSVKSIAPANSPKCPNTPEMQRKFGPGLVRNSVRVTNRELNTRMSEPPGRNAVNHQSRRTEPTRHANNRLTKSRSTTREFQTKNQDKGPKKLNQHRSSSSLASKEVEFSNWKKRSSYDPMKAAQEGKRKQQLNKKVEPNKDDLSSPSHSSPVHRSQSFHSTNMVDLEIVDYSSEETEDDPLITALPMDHPMITSTHSDILDLRPKSSDYKEVLRRKAINNDVMLSRDYVTKFQVNQPSSKKQRDFDKRKTFIIDDITPTKENIDFLSQKAKEKEHDQGVDKRKTFILDSDTNSTTNGSSPRNSSIFSHEKNSLTTGTSDTEGESGTESAPVVLRHPTGKRGIPIQGNKRHSGDYSMSSSTTSISRDQQRRAKDIQPRYLDISKYKNDSSPKNFLRRDPSKTYVGVLNNDRAGSVSKGSAQHYEMEQKKQELEKWKRRASYDPRKSAALGKTSKAQPKTASVLRSQSFHGPVLVSTFRYQSQPTQIAETENYDASSDNDF